MIASKSLDALLVPVKQRIVTLMAAGEMALEAGYRQIDFSVRPIYTFRDNEFQDSLYAQGRTKVGKKVTNAKGGDSVHNYRCAADLGVWMNGEITYEPKYYKVLGAEAKKIGLKWGGDWNGNGVADKNDWDLMHFEYTGGLSLAQLKSGMVPNA